MVMNAYNCDGAELISGVRIEIGERSKVKDFGKKIVLNSKVILVFG